MTQSPRSHILARMMEKVLFLLIPLIPCLLIFSMNAHAGNNHWQGTSYPVHLPAIGFLEAFQFSPIIFGPQEVARGEWSVSSTVTWVNVWAYNSWKDVYTHYNNNGITSQEKTPLSKLSATGSYLVDLEAICISNYFGYGCSQRLDVMVAIPVYYLGGGIMDDFIENFHDTFSLDQHRRTAMDKNRARIFFGDHDGSPFSMQGSQIEGVELGNIVLDLGYRMRGSKPAISLRTAIKFPTHTGVSPTGQEGVDASFMYSTSWRWGNAYWHHGGGLIYYGDLGHPSLMLKQWRLCSATTIEYMTKYRFSGLFHMVANSSPAEYPKLDENVIEGSVGLRFYRDAYIVDVAVMENFGAYDNSPDFGLFFEVRRRYGRPF